MHTFEIRIKNVLKKRYNSEISGCRTTLKYNEKKDNVTKTI